MAEPNLPKWQITWNKRKEELFSIIQIGDKSNRISRMFDFFITVTIIANILVTFLQTFSQLATFASIFKAIEVITIAIFCVEYLLRIWTAEYLYPERSRARARLASNLFPAPMLLMIGTFTSFAFMTSAIFAVTVSTASTM